MFCPRCNHEDTKVLETRLGKGNHSIRRRRECLACAHRFSTIEEIVREGLAVVKRNGAREEFDMGKIAAGIRKATDKRPIEVERINLLISEVVEGLQAKFEDEVPSSAIGEEIMAKLQGVDQIAYVRYASVYREFRDIEELAKAIEQLRKGGKVK
ncbi:MAG: transcriptional repressor NrdR [Verrucomicrobia bacterium]|jgi:transcriptional repressor NrdR|nr:transcriptional repressor NrdR [Verrucomicrobiota bacterium]NBS04106.1 transcriptional repressor NrdR [Verrucomicrobiota bacterium]NBY36368.1 transcriptional repressor NrdR [Verrucomicrobiota bacterium]